MHLVRHGEILVRLDAFARRYKAFSACRWPSAIFRSKCPPGCVLHSLAILRTAPKAFCVRTATNNGGTSSVFMQLRLRTGIDTKPRQHASAVREVADNALDRFGHVPHQGRYGDDPVTL